MKNRSATWGPLCGLTLVALLVASCTIVIEGDELPAEDREDASRPPAERATRTRAAQGDQPTEDGGFARQAIDMDADAAKPKPPKTAEAGTADSAPDLQHTGTLQCTGRDGDTELAYSIVFGELVSVTRCEVGTADQRAVEMYTTATIGYPCNVGDWQFGYYSFAFATKDGGDTYVELECIGVRP